ncbi:hypothetical protein [Streptomyces sp900129855]|uniref:Uncharacterized protein n=1 Tax=Streptomyces sp. 900129855 TaxID=3155129 RepID=A0ABV2ZX75_9ACTN
MLTHIANEDSRLSFWLRVREFAVPASMIETATARRHAGDWAGACAAAGIDVDFNLRAVAREHGQDLAARVRADLRHLAPDLLRWHLPRIAPDGLLRPGLTVPLARYEAVGRGRGGVRPVHLVVRTPPAWADAGQRISLALWDASSDLGTTGSGAAGSGAGGSGASGSGAGGSRHPHPRPSRRFRLDLHRHLWDARRAGELRVRCGADRPPPGDDPPPPTVDRAAEPSELGCAVDRWAAEARIVLRAAGRTTGSVLVRFGAGQRLVLDPGEDGEGAPVLRSPSGCVSALPVLPDAATWVLPDLELLRRGAIEAERLHPLVASALVPEHAASGASRLPDRAGRARFVDCRGATHRIGLVDGVLAPLDHDPAEIRREELLAALTGTPLPCLQAVDAAHRRPDCLAGVRERLVHGDIVGALAVVEGLLGPDAVLRDGALRDELEAAARRRIAYGLFRAGLIGPGPGQDRRRPPRMREHPRHGIRR